MQDKKENKKQKEQRIEQKISHLISGAYSPTDPTGSYTGVPKNPNETPVQDADDL